MQDEIKKFSEYEMQDFSIEEFCQMHKSLTHKITPNEIGKSTVNMPTEEKNKAQQRVTIDEKSIEIQDQQHEEQ